MDWEKDWVGVAQQGALQPSSLMVAAQAAGLACSHPNFLYSEDSDSPHSGRLAEAAVELEPSSLLLPPPWLYSARGSS